MLIQEWQWDDGNLDECARAGFSPRTVDEVTAASPRFRANRGGRAATHQMIGPDRGGRFWVICIVEVTSMPGLWRAITGWTARDHEREWYKKAPRSES